MANCQSIKAATANPVDSSGMNEDLQSLALCAFSGIV
jgi:hypothetical protein